jgi:hypothetical protein
MGLILRSEKGSKIEIDEMDNNLLYLEALTEIGGTHYVFVQGNGTQAENGVEFLSAYTMAKSMTPNGVPLSTSNRVTVVVAPGQYYFDTTLILDGSYVDVVSLTGNRDILIQDAEVFLRNNDMFINGIETSNIFSVETNLNLLIVKNCKSSDLSFRTNILSGTYINCIAGDHSFAGTTLNGRFIDCESGDDGFNGNNCNGTFTNCVGGETSFGTKGNASGLFTNCSAGVSSFGAGGYTTGTFINCVGDDNSFGGLTFTANLYFCRLTPGSGKFPTSGGGIFCCVNGEGKTVNTGGSAAIVSETQI